MNPNIQQIHQIQQLSQISKNSNLKLDPEQEMIFTKGSQMKLRSTNRLNYPYSHSILETKNSYTYHDSETAILTGLRDWSLKYFQDVYIFDTRTSLPCQKLDSVGEKYYKCFDIHGKIVSCQLVEVEVKPDTPEKKDAQEMSI